MVLVEVERATSVDTSPDVVWILAVGSDARPGEDMTRTRGDALQLVGLNTRTGRGDGDRHPARLLRVHPRPRQRPGQRRALLRRPTAARRDGRQHDRHPARVRLRHPVQDVPEDGQQHRRRRTSTTRSRSATPTSRPTGFKAGRIRLGGYTALAFARVRKNLIGGDFDRSANQQRVLRGIQQKIREKSRHARLARARRAQRDGQHGHRRRLAGRALPARPRGRVAEALEVHHVRRAGRLRHVGGASVVTPYLDQARRYGDEARNDATSRAAEEPLRQCWR